jgi:hypothetical protein
MQVISNNSNITINNNRFANNETFAIYFSGPNSNMLISNNFFYNHANSPVIAGNSATDLLIYNNSFYNNILAIYTMLSTVDIKNNIFMNHLSYCIGFLVGDAVTADYNLYYNNTAIATIITDTTYSTLADWQAAGYDANSVEEDPLFVSTTADSEDLHLQSGSPAIDAGNDLSASLITDYDNEDRPYNNVFDIGGDERPVPQAPTDFGATVLSDTSAEVYWTAPSTTVASYTLYIGQAADLSDAHAYDGITYTTYDLSDLTAGATYYVQLQSKYVTDYQEYLSGYTTIFSFALGNPTPNQVQNVKVPRKYKKPHQVRVKWDSAGDNLTYQVKLMNKKGKKIKSYSTTDLKKTIKKLKAGKTYKVKVRAKYDDDHVGAWSTIVKFKTLS